MLKFDTDEIDILLDALSEYRDNIEPDEKMAKVNDLIKKLEPHETKYIGS